jgi:hypothetical protein
MGGDTIMIPQALASNHPDITQSMSVFIWAGMDLMLCVGRPSAADAGVGPG